MKLGIAEPGLIGPSGVASSTAMTGFPAFAAAASISSTGLPTAAGNPGAWTTINPSMSSACERRADRRGVVGGGRPEVQLDRRGDGTQPAGGDRRLGQPPRARIVRHDGDAVAAQHRLRREHRTVLIRSVTVGTSISPQWRYSALFVGPRSAPVRTATIGRRCETRLAMRANRRGSPRSSVYMPITRVESSSSKNCSRSVARDIGAVAQRHEPRQSERLLPGQLEERGAERPGLHRDRHVAFDQPLRQQRRVEADLRARRGDPHARRSDDAHPVVARPGDHARRRRHPCRRPTSTPPRRGCARRCTRRSSRRASLRGRRRQPTR